MDDLEVSVTSAAANILRSSSRLGDLGGGADEVFRQPLPYHPGAQVYGAGTPNHNSMLQNGIDPSFGQLRTESPIRFPHAPPPRTGKSGSRRSTVRAGNRGPGSPRRSTAVYNAGRQLANISLADPLISPGANQAHQARMLPKLKTGEPSLLQQLLSAGDGSKLAVVGSDGELHSAVIDERTGRISPRQREQQVSHKLERDAQGSATLAYSRKPRQVGYTPYTVTDYNERKARDSMILEGLSKPWRWDGATAGDVRSYQATLRQPNGVATASRRTSITADGQPRRTSVMGEGRLHRADGIYRAGPPSDEVLTVDSVSHAGPGSPQAIGRRSHSGSAAKRMPRRMARTANTETTVASHLMDDVQDAEPPESMPPSLSQAPYRRVLDATEYASPTTPLRGQAPWHNRSQFQTPHGGEYQYPQPTRSPISVPLSEQPTRHMPKGGVSEVLHLARSVAAGNNDDGEAALVSRYVRHLQQYSGVK